jgi:hypothetical protein
MDVAALGHGWNALISGIVLAVLGVLLRKGWKLNVLATRAFVDIIGTPEQPSLRKELDTVKNTVNVLRQEVHPNNGKSLGAAVNEIRVMATEAKEKAADAAAEAEGLAGAVARFHADAQKRAAMATRERTGVQETLDVLLRSLSEFADERHQKERAYIGALQHLGIDLTHVTNELDSGECPPHTHHVETLTSEPEVADVGDSDAR